MYESIERENYQLLEDMVDIDKKPPRYTARETLMNNQSPQEKTVLHNIASLIEDRYLRIHTSNSFLALNQILDFIAEIYFMTVRDLKSCEEGQRISDTFGSAIQALLYLIQDANNSKCNNNSEIRDLCKKINQELNSFGRWEIERTCTYQVKGELVPATIRYSDLADTISYIRDPISGSWSMSGAANEERLAKISNVSAELAIHKGKPKKPMIWQLLKESSSGSRTSERSFDYVGKRQKHRCIIS